MHIQNAHLRLFSLWGLIDEQHNELIASNIRGNKVLDVGCGYGSLVNYLTARGFDAEGIDYDSHSVAVAHELFPKARVRLVSAEQMNEHPNTTFDAVVLKDCLHHLIGDGDARKSFAHLRRVLKPEGQLVILDPNPVWLVRLCRKIIGHVDPEARLESALRLLDEEQFRIEKVQFFETIGLPLSGGYVGLRLVPNFLNKPVASANRLLSGVANALNFGRHVCWRYVISARKHT